MKQHKLITSLSAITVFAAASATAQVTWQHEWTDATSFGDATNPTWVRGVSGSGQTLDDSTAGDPAIFTTTNSAGFNFVNTDPTDNAFGPSTGDGITVEFRTRVASQLGTAGAGGLTVRGSVSNKRYPIVLTETGVKFFEAGTEYTMDTSVFNDFRLTFDDAGTGGALLYVNGGTTPVLTQTVAGSTGLANDLRIGDMSGGDNIAGVTEWEYVRWTNEGQFSPIPEPSSFAALFGFTALGFALSRRRVRS